MGVSHWVQDCRKAEHAFYPWVRLAVLVYGVTSVLDQFDRLTTAHRYAVLFHDLRVIITQPDVFPRPTPPSTFTVWSLPVAIGTVAAGIAYLVWQHRAATTAQALGYPARHSPGWGVAAWIVPVVSLWMPFRAVRDCLPPGHPARVLVARAWGLLIASWVLGAAVIPLLAERHPVGVVAVIAQIILLVLLTATALAVVGAIEEDHKAAVDVLISA